MAKNYKHTKNVTETIKIKGVISDNGSTITYVGDDDLETTSFINEIADIFDGKEVSLTISISDKTEEDA